MSWLADFLSLDPITILSGWRASLIAVPSFKNSGLAHSPSSAPTFFPLDSSRECLTTLFVVPGTTVLLTTTRWYPGFLERDFPRSATAVLRYLKSIEPSAPLGVPTVRKVVAVSMAWEMSVVASRRLVLTAFLNMVSS